MSKRLILILALAFIVGMSYAAFAETQNVKVSGDLTLSAIYRDDFTLSRYADESYNVSGFTSLARLRVDADLTDNVAVTLRLINERSWGHQLLEHELDYDYEDGYSAASDTAVGIDLAYVVLKEFLYSPLTLTLGRQNLRFGNALIIGDPDTNMLSLGFGVPFDLSARKAFDAIRATLNYDPLVIDLIYAKLSESDLVWWGYGQGEDNDVDLYGVNVRRDISDLGINGSAEVYYFNRSSRYPIHYGDAPGDKSSRTHTIGLLLSLGEIRGLTGSLEYAYQFGRQQDDVFWGSNEDMKRRAWALQAALNYALPIAQKYEPNVGLMYTYLSGDKNADDNKFTAWDPMCEDQTLNSIPNALFPHSGMQVINAKASMKPTEDITLSAVYGYYRLTQDVSGEAILGPVYGVEYRGRLDDIGMYGWSANEDKDLGHALDLTATYDYTEDVQFGLTFGMFDPGKAFDSDYDRTAEQIIGSMKVTF